jgi:CheY-like chemotaxis protein
MITGPIVIVDDDIDDREVYQEIIREIGIGNQIVLIDNATAGLEYLYTTTDKPFIILSDINMPIMDGLQFKQKIQDDNFLRAKGIPFVFITTNVTADAVRKAHVLSVQGLFQKPNSMEEIKSMLRLLFDYWALCKHINNI